MGGREIEGRIMERAEARKAFEKAAAQGLNDFAVFGTVTISALASGALHHAFGWNAINMVMVPFTVLGFWWHHRMKMSL